MTIQDLIDRLEEERDMLGPDAEVRMLSQPNWPFEYSIAGVTIRSEVQRCGDADEEGPEDEEEDCVFLCEGTQLCYGPRDAWSACR